MFFNVDSAVIYFPKFLPNLSCVVVVSLSSCYAQQIFEAKIFTIVVLYAVNNNKHNNKHK